jgi:hypothetical protein
VPIRWLIPLCSCPAKRKPPLWAFRLLGAAAVRGLRLLRSGPLGPVLIPRAGRS